MFPVFPTALVLVCACASSAGINNGTNNGTSNGTSNGTNKVTQETTDYYEPPDNIISAYEYGFEEFSMVQEMSINGPAVLNETNINGTWVVNVTSIKRVKISEEALLFLTGSVSTILIPSFYTLICLFSLPINICAVVAFTLRIKPMKTAAIYMLNLACADVLFAVLLPFKISYHFGGNNWIFGSLMCRVVTAAFYWNMYCSVLLITCISVDRLLGVVYPLNSLSWRRPKKAIMACVTMWILSFAGTVPLVIDDQTFHLSQLNITTCHDVQPVHEIMLYYKFYFIALCCAFFILPLLITVGSYTRVIWALSRVPRGVLGSSGRTTRAVVMTGTVLVIFVLCFTPTHCLLMARYLQFNGGAEAFKETSSYAAYLVCMCLGSLNCLLDPLVYYFGSSQCRKQLSSTLRCEKLLEDISGHSISGLSSRLTRMRTTRSSDLQVDVPPVCIP
ncbi:proteinase-activated receptor 1 isoform X2 [Pleuronectes platessa]|uniref:proteinase-activated receptor 1 isoform X2 n=1 Tax=Pleuronectes platessa TaxID=8262 RepID=UPI00232A1359|nr:proteinase-activated receptor 1 isoform X2 [Pleuronectes platessa]